MKYLALAFITSTIKICVVLTIVTTSAVVIRSCTHFFTSFYLIELQYHPDSIFGLLFLELVLVSSAIFYVVHSHSSHGLSCS